MRVSLGLTICFSALVGFAGCGGASHEGPQTVKVTGTVTLDGEPVEGAHVTFAPQAVGPVAFAVTDSRGNYQLRTAKLGNGAIPGQYEIFLVKDVKEGGMEFESEADLEAYVQQNKGQRPPAGKVVNQLPVKYANRKTSGLTAEITTAKDNRFDLELTSK